MDSGVLIVGAGPTGLMLAIQLVRRGIGVTIVDRGEGPARQTRAVGVQARTLELYAQLGLAGEALMLGRRAEGANLWSGGRRNARIPLGEAGGLQTRFPYMLMLGQDDNEAILGRQLAALGVAIRWRTEVVALHPHDAGVTVTLRGTDGSSSSVDSAWVAGCDGAHSFVRGAAGIAFPGAPYEQVFYVADTVARGDMVDGEINVYLRRNGFHLFFPLRGAAHWRLVGILPVELRDREGLRFDDLLPSIRAEAGEALQFSDCRWFSTYRIHHRHAARFRAGRCFVLGDAAHVHSPVGAQGMNTGLQDAYNLAWKLALVIRGEAAPTLLDSYEAERLPVARRLLATTDRMFSLVVSENRVAALVRTRVIARLAAFAMARASLRRMAFRIISQIGVRYANSPLSRPSVGLPSNAPQPGARFPWLRLRLAAGAEEQDLFELLPDTRFHLLLFDLPAPPAVALAGCELLDVHPIPGRELNAGALAAAGVPAPSYFLLRPDGHIALAGAMLDPTRITAWFAALR